MAGSAYRTKSGRKINLGQKIGDGGGGAVYRIADNASLVVKLLAEPERSDIERVEAMVAKGVPPQAGAAKFVLAWPQEIVYDRHRQFAGFTMAAAAGPRPITLYKLANKREREQVVRNLGFKSKLEIGANYAAAVDFLHRRGVVVGDINESNAMVSGNRCVTVIDCDSMTIRANGRVHHTAFHKEDFLAPELRGVDLEKTHRSPVHDMHAFAMLLWMMFMEGYNPFTGRWKGRGEQPRAVENACEGRFSYDPACRELDPPADAPPWEAIPPRLQTLFLTAFTDGIKDPLKRPKAADWNRALTAAVQDLVTCTGKPRHHHAAGLKSCPWCDYDRHLAAPGPSSRAIPTGAAGPVQRRVQPPPAGRHRTGAQPPLPPPQPPPRPVRNPGLARILDSVSLYPGRYVFAAIVVVIIVLIAAQQDSNPSGASGARASAGHAGNNHDNSASQRARERRRAQAREAALARERRREAPARAIRAHYDAIDDGDYRRAFMLMTAGYRAAQPGWLSQFSSAQPHINLARVGSPRISGSHAVVDVSFYARDSYDTPESDTRCRHFTGIVNLVKTSDGWRYSPPGEFTSRVVDGSPRCP